MNLPEASEILETAGRVLYGMNWQTSLARDIGVSSRLVRYWAAGIKPVPYHQWQAIAALLQSQSTECNELARDIIASINRGNK